MTGFLKNKYLLLFLLSSFMLSACSGGGSGNNNDTGETSGTSTDASSGGSGSGSGSTSNTVASQVALDIIGTWQSSCEATGSGQYFITIHTYESSGEFINQDILFSDPTCTTAAGIVNEHIGDYTLGNDFVTDSGLTAVEIDIEITENYSNGTPAGLVPYTWLDIVYIDVQDHLYTGMKSSLSSDRPTDINTYYSTRTTSAGDGGGSSGGGGTSGGGSITYDFHGTWHTECYFDAAQSSASNPVYSYHTAILNSDGTFILRFLQFDGPGCDTNGIYSNYLGRDDYEGTYSVLGDLLGTGNTQALFIVDSATGKAVPFDLYAVLKVENNELLLDYSESAYPQSADISNPFSHFTNGGNPNINSCTAIDIPGEPDILGDISYSQPNVSSSSDTTVTVSVPVDADTGYVNVFFFNSGDSTLGGDAGVSIATPSEQTVDVAVTVNAGNALFGEQYLPMVLVCTDINSCNLFLPGGSGIGIAYFSNADPNRLERDMYYDNGVVANLEQPSCITKTPLDVDL